MNVLICPDKFKGSLTARKAAAAMAAGWQAARPRDVLHLLPMSDGGDGFGDVLGDLLGAKPRRLRTVDAAHRPCISKWWQAGDLAVVESASVIGLSMLPTGLRKPFQLDTAGLGLALKTLAKRGNDRCLLGIGGSATNDGGFGLAKELGWGFLDCNGRPLRRWTDLDRLRDVRPSDPGMSVPRDITVAVDVMNQLLGPKGSTRVYGPQKGLRLNQLSKAEHCLAQLAKVMAYSLGRDASRVPGAGAAGGLGFGLLAFAGARLVPGFEVFAELAGLKEQLLWADLVVTGEGRIDSSTLMGKGVGKLADLCAARGLRCVGIAGTLDLGSAQSRFSRLAGLTQITSEEEAIRRPNLWLRRLTAQVSEQIGSRPGRA